MRLVTDDSANVAAWVRSRIPFPRASFGECVAVGVVGNDGQALGGVVFHDYQPECGTMCFSIAADSARWCTKRLIGRIMLYPFEQAGVNKLWAVMAAGNERAIRLSKGLGFKQEARLHQHFGKQDAVVVRLFAREYRHIYGELLNGKIYPNTAAAS